MSTLVDAPLRVYAVDPGIVNTEFSLVRFHGDRARAKKAYVGLTPLTASDVAGAVSYPLRSDQPMDEYAGWVTPSRATPLPMRFSHR